MTDVIQSTRMECKSKLKVTTITTFHWVSVVTCTCVCLFSLSLCPRIDDASRDKKVPPHTLIAFYPEAKYFFSLIKMITRL